MKKIMSWLLVLTSLFSCIPTVSMANSEVTTSIDNIDWQTFMARNDLVWSKIPTGYTNAPFLGNGTLGTWFMETDDSKIDFEISRQDVYDHRKSYSSNSPTQLFSNERLPNGYLTLDYAGYKSVSGDFRLSLWDAEVSGNINTTSGSIKLNAFTHATKNVIVIDTFATGYEKDFTIDFIPRISKSPRSEKPPANYVAYPEQTRKVVDGINVSVQEMPEDAKYNTDGQGVGQYATAWVMVDNGDGHRTIYVSEGFSYPGQTAADEAVQTVKDAVSEGVDSLRLTHQEWWHNTYPRSFISIPDARIESMYWAQIYKLLSSTREDSGVMDLMGPWYKDSTWPAVWQNLNIQSQYSPYYIAGYNDMAMSMLNYYADNMETLAYNTWREQQGLPNPDPVKGWYYSIGGSASNLALGKSTATAGSSPGDFLYAMNNLWQQYRATMDDEMLREKLFPLLKGAFNQIETIFTMHEDDGKYHIDIPTWSPEWEATVDGVITSGYTTDTNYVLALSKWLAKVIIEANDRLDLDDEVAVRAKELYDNITPYQVDESGFMVGAETWVKKDGVMTKIKDATPFSRSHRHWSHLFMIYPLYEYTYDNEEQIDLIDRSLDNYLKDESLFAGYSYVAASSINSIRGNGDNAIELLNKFCNKHLKVNTLYVETSKEWPCIETPLLAARAVQDMQIQGYNGIIRVFPAIPSTWDNCAFRGLIVDGGFSVDAKYQNKDVEFVRITSNAGEPLKVAPGFKTGTVKIYSEKGSNHILKPLENGVYEIENMEKGDTAILYTSDVLPDISISPVAYSDTETVTTQGVTFKNSTANFFGAKEDKIPVAYTKENGEGTSIPLIPGKYNVSDLEMQLTEPVVSLCNITDKYVIKTYEQEDCIGDFEEVTADISELPQSVKSIEVSYPEMIFKEPGERYEYTPILDTFIRRGQYSISSDKQTNLANLANDSYANKAYGKDAPRQIQMEAYTNKGYLRRDAFLKFKLDYVTKQRIKIAKNQVLIQLKNITLSKGSGMLFEGYILPYDKLSVVTDDLTYYQAVENDISLEENAEKYTQASGATTIGLTSANDVVEMDITNAIREYVNDNPSADEFAIMLCISPTNQHQSIDSRSIERTTTDNSYNMVIVQNQIEINGTVNDNITWTIIDGTLIISGTGAMSDYGDKSNLPPWYDYRELIKNAVIDDGITYIGKNSFVGHKSLKRAVMPDTVKTVGPYVFNGCAALESVVLSEQLESIPEGVFNNTKALKHIIVPSKTKVKQHSFRRTPYDLVISVYAGSDAYLWATGGTGNETPAVSMNRADEPSQKITRTYKVISSDGTELDYYLGNYSADNGTEQIGIYSKAAGTGTDKVVFASYDNDSLTSVSVVDIALAAGINNVTAGSIFAPAEGDDIKVMLWDDIKPLVEPFRK